MTVTSPTDRTLVRDFMAAAPQGCGHFLPMGRAATAAGPGYVMVYCAIAPTRAHRQGEARPRVRAKEGDAPMSRYCLVMLQTPLVAQDLALTLEDLTGCAPILATRVEDACEKLAPLAPGSVLYAFVQSDAEGLDASPLREALERTGARLVLMGHAAEMEAADGAGRIDCPILVQPFGPAQVAKLLDRCPPPPMHRATPPDGALQT